MYEIRLIVLERDQHFFIGKRRSLIDSGAGISKLQIEGKRWESRLGKHRIMVCLRGGGNKSRWWKKRESQADRKSIGESKKQQK